MSAMSHVSCAYCHAASSSHQMSACCGPRRRSGFSAVKPRIVAILPESVRTCTIRSVLL